VGGVILYGGHGRRFPLAVTAELAQPSNAASAATAKTEVERLRRYLEVSYATLEVVEQEM
jgi:hypothetical protein